MSPLKSLTQEKYDDWKTRFPQQKLCILTGDYTLSEEKSKELNNADIILCTSEMVDSRTRRMESEKGFWLKQVGLLIVDESHIISTSRGHAVESGIMRFSNINPSARILFLSATMPNVGQLGEWLTLLNGKITRVIYSTWRPVQLNLHFVEYEHTDNYKLLQDIKKNIAVNIVKSKPSEKFLIFCHDKATGNSLVKWLETEGIQAKFHNADLDMDERLDVEALFTKREGGLRVLVSTSTLAWGRNLPARNVIVVGVHRGIQEVDELDIIQMAGRAGRYGIDTEGHVYLIIPEDSTEDWKDTFDNPRPVTSVLKDHQVMAFHILAEIQNKVITNPETLIKWYYRSLAYFQKQDFTLADAKGLLSDLEKMEMIINKNMFYVLTGLGKVSGWLYFSPYTVYAWYKNFDKLYRCNPCIEISKGDSEPRYLLGEPNNMVVDDLSISWALTDTPENNWGYIPRDIQKEVEDMRWKLRNREIMATDAIHIGLGAFKCLSGEEVKEGSLKASIRTIRYDILRICQALNLIDQLYGQWRKDELWKTLPIRILYGIPESLLPLVKLPGIGGVKAKKMYEKGIKTLKDVANRTDIMKTLFVPTMVSKLQNEAKKILLGGKNG
jgi:replicative superfamily II helicase